MNYLRKIAFPMIMGLSLCAFNNTTAQKPNSKKQILKLQSPQLFRTKNISMKITISI